MIVVKIKSSARIYHKTLKATRDGLSLQSIIGKLIHLGIIKAYTQERADIDLARSTQAMCNSKIKTRACKLTRDREDLEEGSEQIVYRRGVGLPKSN